MKERGYWRKPPCPCPECKHAGMSDKELVRDGRTHEWLHGAKLAAWYAAKDDFERRVQAAFSRRTMR